MGQNGALCLRTADNLPTLPIEILRSVFESAAENAASTSLPDLVAYSVVSTTVRGWLLPIVYRTIHVDTESRWRAFHTAALRHGALPVLNLSVIGFQPGADEFQAVLDVLPLLRNVQAPLCFAPTIPRTRAACTVSRLFVSKHGPPTAEPLAPALCSRVTHVFYEPFYTGLYPAGMRAALPLAFPRATHFGILWIATAGDAVARDLMALARDMLALPHMRRFYIRVYAPEMDQAERDASKMREMCAVLRDSRVVVGPASLNEWAWKPGRKDCKAVSTLWAADAYKEFDLWNHGEPAYDAALGDGNGDA